MGLVICVDCGKEHSDMDKTICPNCGRLYRHSFTPSPELEKAMEEDLLLDKFLSENRFFFRFNKVREKYLDDPEMTAFIDEMENGWDEGRRWVWYVRKFGRMVQEAVLAVAFLAFVIWVLNYFNVI